MTYMYEISQDLDVSYQDQGPWRSYQLEAMGDSFEQLWDNAFVYELDKDGGELNLYHAMEAPKQVFEKVEEIMNGYVHDHRAAAVVAGED